MASAGSLVVSLGLDAAKYTDGLTKAEYKAKQFATRMGQAVESGVALAIGSLGAIAASGAAAFAFLDRQAENIAGFQGLADKIGDTAENIASLKLASDISGVSLDAIAATSVKLTGTLAKVDDESKGAAAGIKSLGIDFDAFKRMSPAAQFDAIAQGLAKFEDGAEKTAWAVAVLGKSGPDMLALFQDLADGAQRQITLTEAQIQAADAYTKQTARLRSEMDSFAQQTAVGLIPALSNLVDILQETFRYMRESETGATLLGAAMGGVTNIIQTLVVVASDVAFVLKGVGTEIGGIAAQAAALMRMDFKGFSAISEAMKEDAARARKELDRFQSNVLSPFIASPDDQSDAESRRLGLTKPRPRLNVAPTWFATGGGGGGAGDNVAKAMLDAQLKAVDSYIRQEETLLQTRERMLDLYNGEALVSTRDYYASRQAAQQEAVSKQSALYDQEIAALERYRAAVSKPTEREGATAKINELTEKKSELYRKAAQSALEMGFAERKAVDGLARQMDAVNAQVLELTGNLQAAAGIRLDEQYRDLSARLTANGDSAGLTQVKRLKELQIAQAAYAQQTAGVSQITEGLRLQEERIALSRQLGASTELDALLRLGEARQGAITQMQAMVAAQEAIARASGSPALVLQADQARLALEQLVATANPLGDKLSGIFSDAAGSGLADFINGTKSAKEAFADFANSVTQQLVRMASNSMAESLLGGMFSAQTTGSSGGNAAGWVSMLAGLFGYASGGSVGPGQMVRVNENGPELLDYQGKQYLMNGNRNARITSNADTFGGKVVHINVPMTAAPNMSRATAQQQGLDIGRGIQRAMARNG